MDIKGSDIQPKLGTYQSAKVQGSNIYTVKFEKPEASSPQQDRVALSDRGRSIADAQRAMASVPDVRESLVSKIRTDLQDGTYNVDPQMAAEGILRESMVNHAAMM
jgi:negative regulator of flagellin synthesis FlgM